MLRFDDALKKRKYRLLYSPKGGRKLGPTKPPSKEVIPGKAGQALNAVVEIKQRNPQFGCPRIAQQINLAFGLDLDKDTVRRVLDIHYKPDPSNRGRSWLTTIGHAKDSLWTIRRELLDHTLFWTARDLENKLSEYQCYYNESRAHSGRDGTPPVNLQKAKVVNINEYSWEKHCRGLFQLPIAA